MGFERDSRYYDDSAFRELYQMDYDKSPYYKLWCDVAGFLNNNDKILELGCGTGQFAKMLEDIGYTDYLGLDFSYESINVAKSKSKQSFQVANVLDLEMDFFKDRNTFLALEIFEHIYDDLKVFNKLSGKIILTVPTFDDPSHVRVFKNERAVLERYPLKNPFIKAYSAKGKIKWYLLKGEK